MSATFLARLITVGLLGFLAFAGAALAEMSLAEAIKQEDAKYLAAPDVTAKDDAPKIEAGNGEEGSVPKPQEISQAAVKAALSYAEAKGDDGEITRTPIVTIFANGKEVAELDASNQTPEVVVSFYTGGAHCCSDTSVVESSGDGSVWKTIDVGEFDGGPLLASDLDGDGRYEFETRDNAFLYAFGCYACSTAPLELIGIDNGEVKNITTEDRFKPAHAAYLKEMIGEAPGGGSRRKRLSSGLCRREELARRERERLGDHAEILRQGVRLGTRNLRPAGQRKRRLPRPDDQAHLPRRARTHA